MKPLPVVNSSSSSATIHTVAASMLAATALRRSLNSALGLSAPDAAEAKAQTSARKKTAERIERIETKGLKLK
ncbi:hypothetical protein FACS1894187_20400 [Synergistales bacterium]|nr:hypothetical protein FACS1894187_20400 [Synergistales bacterium]